MPSPYWQLNDPEWLRTEYLERGRTGRDIAAEIGCHRTTLDEALGRHGIRRPARKVATQLPKRWLRDQYVRRRRSIRDIAADVGVAPKSIRRALEQAGVPIGSGRLPRELDDAAWMTARADEDPAELAATLGCSIQAVSNARRRHGMRTGRPSPFPLLDDAAWLRARYHDDRWTQLSSASPITSAARGSPSRRR